MVAGAWERKERGVTVLRYGVLFPFGGDENILKLESREDLRSIEHLLRNAELYTLKGKTYRL